MMNEDRSPLAQCLAQYSISTSEASFLAKMTPAAISSAKSGGPIPQRLLDALARLKVDTAALIEAQARYRAHRASGIEDRVLNKVAAGAVTK